MNVSVSEEKNPALNRKAELLQYISSSKLPQEKLVLERNSIFN